MPRKLPNSCKRTSVYAIAGLTSLSIGGALMILTGSFWPPMIVAILVDVLLLAILLNL